MVSTFVTIIDTVFNPVFGWMLRIPPVLAIILLALILGLISTLLQKYLTNQSKMRRLKDDTKKYQDQLKKLRDKPEEMMKVQQKVLPIQMELMKESFKPLLVSLLPFLLVFFWLSNHFAYHELQPNTRFGIAATFTDGIAGNATLTASGLTIDAPTQEIVNHAAHWTAQGSVGEYKLDLQFAGQTIGTRDVLISADRKYESPVKSLSGIATSLNIENQKLVPILRFSFFGWQPGWIFYYIIFSIPISLLLKKWLHVV
jgi:uncharacterized membrane protein (DUF106 family)